METLAGAMSSYLESEQPITSFRNEVRRAVNDAFTMAFYAGWADASPSVEEVPEDAIAWLTGRIEEEIGFADTLFQDLKQLRKDMETEGSEYAEGWIAARAEGYTGTLDAIFAEGKLWGDKEQFLTWREGPTSDKCETCVWLDGQRHPASWFIENGYIPQSPGSETDCHGYNCLCFLENDDGDQIVP